MTILSINGEKLSFFERPSVKLYTPVELTMGDELQALVHLAPVIGVRNQVGFDKEQYYFAHRISAESILAIGSHFIVRSVDNWQATLHQAVVSATENSPIKVIIWR